MNQVITVSQLNFYIKSLLDGNDALKQVFLTGEISNFTDHYRSGHFYFSLKDEKSVIKCVMFSRYSSRVRFHPEDGMKVLVRGGVSVYEASGQYQLYVEDMRPEGIGALNLAFEQLKQKLEKEGFEVVFLTPDADGRVPEEAVLKAVTGDTILISVMAVNNELGSIQPIEVLKKAVKRAGAPALVHVDGVQAYGKLPLRPEKLGIDLLTVSGHKIHGPKGVGALYVSKNARILPRTFGGGQERELRPGTEAAPLIAGLGAAVEELPDWRQSYSRMEKLRDYTLQKLSGLEGVEVNSPVEGLPYLLNFSALGIRSETMLHFLAQRGIYVSSGSACAKGKQSHVLKAAGLPDSRISSAIRVSFSRENTERDADALAEGVREGLACLARARR